MATQRTFSGAPWESQVGYCRAIKVGNQIHVSGCAPISESSETFAPNDAYAQAKRCFEIIESALSNLDAKMSDVVRTRMYVTNITRWQEYGRAHNACFGEHPPATTLLEIKALVNPDMLIEVEAEAILDE